MLLTPPSSSHRRDKDKENKFFEETRSVVWDDVLEIHSLATPLKALTIPSRQRPSAKHSILKKSNQNTSLLVPANRKQRQCTPEPTEILRNEGYLTRPVTQIISVQDPDSSEALAALIEGYNVLAARLRSATTESTDGDSDWPLFLPLRQNTEGFVGAVIRDLGRALVDPLLLSPIAEEEMSKFILPSPEKSPTRKKGGMTGEQVKYARDLCTTCHSAIRALSVIFALPGFHKFFDEKQLRQILAAVLAIPLADELPTPNARKTRALAIWLIQVQRLPAAVLQPAADRIAYALRRGIDGELGKEGKKGSASDGLKAVYDLCEYLPQVFVPAFVPIVPSILSNLLANTLALRTQACHALGGLVLGLTSLPQSSAHTKISGMVASYLTTPAAPTKSDSPTKSTEAVIVRTLRVTMSQTEPEQPAQGPVWALTVLACFIVLLNSGLCNSQVNHTLCNLLAQGLRHKKSSIRALTCLAWRCLSWAYLQPPLPVDSQDGAEVGEEIQEQKKRKRAQSKIITSVLECQTGVANIAALLGDRASGISEEHLRLCLEVLKLMAAKSGHSCYDATQTMMQMVSSINSEQDEQDPWDHNLLLPKSLFSASSGLFTTEYKNLTQAIRPLFENLASVGDVRPLTREELTRDWVLAGLMTAWKSALGHLELCDEADMPPELITTWASLLKVNVDHFKETEDVSAISKLGVTFMTYLTDILQDPDLNLQPNGDLKGVGPANNDAIPDSDGPTPVITGSTTCTNNELRLRIVRRMWNAMKKVFPKLALVDAAEALLACLMRKEQLLLTESAYLASDEEGEQERNSWVALCVDTSNICGPDAMRVFWGCEEGAPVEKMPGTWAWDWTKDFTNAVWKTAVEKWRDDESDWEGAVILLGVPFTDRHAWNLTSEDFNIWEEFLGYATANALDHGVDSSTVLDNISSFVSSFQTPGAQPYLSIRLADLLLSHLDTLEMRTVPQSLVELVSETMRANYPPETRNKAVMRWLARSLMTLVEKCPTEFCLQILQVLEDGVALWLADEHCIWEEDELNYDMIPLYQHILVAIQTLPDPVNILCAVGDVVGSVFTYRTPSLAVEAFVEFWTTSCADVSAPAGGWPEGISRTLRAVGLLPKENLPTPVALSPAFGLMASPRTPISSSYSTPPPVLMRKGLSRIPSPQRPQKAFGSFPVVPTSPVSPIARRQRRITTSAMTPRTPLSNIQIREEPPHKRRRLNGDGKENLGVNNRPLASVSERIADLLKTNGTLLRKRKLETREDDEDTKDSPANSCAPTPLKKMRERMKPKRPKSISATVRVSTSPASTMSSRGQETLHGLSFLSPASTTSRCYESEKALNDPSLPLRDVDQPSMTRSKIVYGRTDRPLAAGGQSTNLEDQVLDPAQIRKIDFNEILKSRSIKRSSSTPSAMWNAIARRKRKWSDIDVGEVDENSGLAKAACRPRRCLVPVVFARRTASLPTPERLDSDSTVVELPLVVRNKCKFTSASLDAGAEMFGSDDAFPGSDDTVVSSSSEEDSPTKDALDRHYQRTSLESKSIRPVLLL